MKDLLVLALMQIPHIGKKTISMMFNNNNIIPSTVSEIKDAFLDAKYHSASIKVPDEIEIQNAVNKAEVIIEKSKKLNISFTSILHDDFPEKLRTIPDPPVILFYKGNYECVKEENSIAVIGTREPTSYGAKIAEWAGKVFAGSNFVVVSGLAIGCDTYGHKGCVDIKGKSIAVLPCGLDKIYPSKNKKLAESILNENGCFVSEYPIETTPFKNYFVERDRLQSGLSKAVFVVETDIIGGTMHTVQFSQNQNRILACFNHPEKYLLEKQAKGNQKLINEGKAISIKDEHDMKNLINKVKEFRFPKSDKTEVFEQLKFN